MQTLRNSALFLCLASAFHASAGDFVDTRLSFVFADDNVLAKSGETTQNSPNAGFGAGTQNTQFFDNFNTKYSGFEKLSNLVLYKMSPSFFEGFTAEAALNVTLSMRDSGAIDFRDNSSYVRVNWRPAGWGEKESVALTGFPVTSDRFRLGYAYKISWGGNSIFTYRAVNDGIPAARLQVTRDTWYAFAGTKTALLYNDLVREKERLYGYLVGGGVDVHPLLRLEAGGGFFQKGIVPGLADQGINAPVNAIGGSAQLVYHLGAPIGTSVDFRLYKNDPDVYQRFFQPEAYPGGLSAVVSLEGTFLAQSLADPDVFGKTKLQNAIAGALQAKLKYDYLRLNLTGLYRSLSYIQFDVPSFPPYYDFPSGTVVRPELFVAVGADYHFPAWHFTPGVVVGVQQPPSFKSPSSNLGGNNPPAGLQGARTVVVRDVNTFATLPAGFDPILVFSAKLTGRLDISEYFATIAEVYYTRDPNKVTFRDDTAGIAQPTFEKEHGLGFNVIVQARF